MISLRKQTAPAPCWCGRGKTDPEGRGACLYLAPDTVALVLAWRRRGGVDAGRLFRSVGKDGTPGGKLDPSQVPRILKAMARRAGLPPEIADGLSGHSARVGAAQDMVAGGIGLPAILQAGRWKTTAMVNRYGERLLARPQRNGAARPVATAPVETRPHVISGFGGLRGGAGGVELSRAMSALTGGAPGKGIPEPEHEAGAAPSQGYGVGINGLRWESPRGSITARWQYVSARAARLAAWLAINTVIANKEPLRGHRPYCLRSVGTACFPYYVQFAAGANVHFCAGARQIWRQRWCSASCRSWSPSPTWDRAVEPGSRGRERRGPCRVRRWRAAFAALRPFG